MLQSYNLIESLMHRGARALIDAMLGPGTGSSLQWREPNTRNDAPVVLDVENISAAGEYSDVSFQTKAGEIIGIAGLMGSGRTEIAQVIFGIKPADRGVVRLSGKTIKSTADAIAASIALVPESRRRQGLVLDHSVAENFLLPNLDIFRIGQFVSEQSVARKILDFIKLLSIKTDSPDKSVHEPSGGNQQKVVLSKWLVRAPKLLILDEPTLGVDIGAKSEIVEIVRKLADNGTAVLVISFEFEELLAMSDRILVLQDGHLAQQLDRRNVASEEVLHHAVQG